MLLALLLMLLTGFSEAHAGTVTGGVRNSVTSAALSGATVRLEQSGSIKYTATSNASGVYSFSAVPTGVYNLVSLMDGFQNWSQSVSVTATTLNQNIAMIPNGAVTGGVRNNVTSAALSGATVRLEQGGVVKYSATSNGSGVFSITNVFPGSYTIVGLAYGFQSTSTGITITSGNTFTQNLALNPDSGTVTGGVRNNVTSAALSGATVRLEQGGVIKYTTTSNASGVYSFSSVPTGSYNLVSLMGGYQNWSQSIAVSAATLTQNIAMIPNGAVTGGVRNNITSAALSGATVRLEQSGVIKYTATTDISGVYTISDVTPGSYTIAGFATGFQSSSTSITIISGNTSFQNLALNPDTGTVTGGVRNNATNAAIQGATVRLEQGGVVKYTTTSNSSGVYTFNLIPPGAYNLVSLMGGYQNWLLAINVTASTLSQNIAMIPNGAVSGGVRNNVTSAALSGATVRLEQSGVIKYTASTNSSGVYTITDVIPGSYTIVGLATGFQNTSTSITITSGTTSSQNLALNPDTGTVTGGVRNNATSAPIQGATVRLEQGGVVKATTTSNASGVYTFSNVATGTYNIVALMTGYLNASQPITVTTGATISQNLALSPDTTSPYPVFIPLFRAYSNTDKDHFYTTSVVERNGLVSSGYKYEKIEVYISDRAFQGGIPLYRYYYGGTKKHYYTTATSSAAAGYTEGPGIIGYVYPNPTDGMVPVYHLLGSTGDHFYTISKFEHDNAVAKYGYTSQGVAFYSSPSAVANNRPQGNIGGVGMFSGAFSHQATDITLNGVGPELTLTRYYNSYSNYEIPLGEGWSHSLYNYAIEDISGNVVIKWGNGSEEIFVNDGSNNYTGILGNFSKLTKLGPDRYDLTTKDQTIYAFGRVSINDVIGASFVPDLPLIYIQDKHGNKISIVPHLSAGRVERVERIVNGITTAQMLAFSYDSQNRLIKISDSSTSPNRNILYGYNAQGYLSTVTDARGNTTTYQYNTDGLLTGITYPEGNSVAVGYDTAGRVTSQTSGTKALSFEYNGTSGGTIVKNGSTGAAIATYSHDNLYRAAQVKFPDSTSILPQYNSGNQLNLQQSVTDRNGKPTSYTYDANGNVLTSTNSLSETTTYTYDDKNNIKTIKDPRNNVTTFTYDANKKNLISVQKPLGGTTTYTYYDNGLINTVKDPTNHITTYTYDAFGNVTKITDNSLATSVAFTNDNAGRRLSQTDQKQQTTLWGYNENDGVTSIKAGSNQAATFAYDRNNRLTSVTDQRGKVTGYQYNSANLLSRQTSPDGKAWQYVYDSYGNVTSVSMPDGNTVSYDYYPLTQRLQNVKFNGAQKISYVYDNNGKIKSVTDSGQSVSFNYDDTGRVVNSTDPFGNIINYGYDASGNRTSITYPGNKTVLYTYDADNRLGTVKDWLNGTTTYTYNTAGVLQSITNANGSTTTYGYDPADRLTSLANKKSNSSVISSYQLTLDTIGNPTTITRNEPVAPAVPTAADITYGYNDANQLQSAGSVTYNHDGLGNLSGSTNGRSFTFDYANRLTRADIGVDRYDFIYDAFGNRISRTKNGTQTKYLLDLNGSMSNVLAETDAAGKVQSNYIHGLGLISRIDSAGQRFTYHFDQLGNTVAVTDDSNSVTESYTYDEFGSVLTSSGTAANPFRYVGKFGVMDEGNGLLHMRARYYDTDSGRFLSRDPLGFDGGDLNLYAYVGGNPLVGIDPKGLSPDPKNIISDKYGNQISVRRSGKATIIHIDINNVTGALKTSLLNAIRVLNWLTDTSKTAAESLIMKLIAPILDEFFGVMPNNFIVQITAEKVPLAEFFTRAISGKEAKSE